MKRNFKDPMYTEWRRKVLERDGHRCQMPGCNRRSRKYLQAHHIQKWSSASHLRYSVDNGITLCWGCHNDKVNKYEHHYVSLFMDIVRKNKGK